MATMQGYVDGSYDYKQMYNVKDLRGLLPIPVIYKDTILGWLMSQPKFKDFFNILKSNQLLARLYNDHDIKITLFVPENVDFKVIDDCNNNTRDYVLAHTLLRPLNYGTLANMKMSYLDTKLNGYRLLVDTTYSPYPVINRKSIVTGYTLIGNSVIYHITNDII